MLDVLVLGSGVAGLAAAVHAAASRLSVVVLTKDEVAASATRYAQGGVAAALDDPDSPELHLSDTLAAGGGLCDGEAVRVLVTEGPARVRELIALGAEFDRTGDGEAAALALAREGGHSLARVVHAGGDATGAEINRALAAAVHATAADVRERWFVTDLIVEHGRCAGVRAIDPDGATVEVHARHVVLASGGAGQVFSVTTNPVQSTGDGIAMALRAGAPVADVEFVQFHPTALHHPAMPRPLLSEALRGDGAVLRDEHGVAFMAAEHPLADLAPRDVVARAIATRLASRGIDHLWLDATTIRDVHQRFPTITRACRQVGLDPQRDWLPVAPAAHYQCGGVLTDLHGATALPGLWACGEVADAGVHGANRLASNSLLDGLVFGYRVIAAIAAGRDGPERSGAQRGAVDVDARLPRSATEPGPVHEGMTAASLRARLQREMTAGAGVLRDAARLEQAATAVREVAALAARLPAGDPAAWEVWDLLAVAGALVDAALAREESRGAHTRIEFPGRDDAFLGRFVRTGHATTFVPLPEHSRRPG
jgi:L-aspartate oxidase